MREITYSIKMNTVLISISLHFRYYRVLISSLLIGVVLLVTSSLVLIDTDSWQRSFFDFTLFSVIVVVGASSLMQSGVVGLAATMEPTFMRVSASYLTYSLGTVNSQISSIDRYAK